MLSDFDKLLLRTQHSDLIYTFTKKLYFYPKKYIGLRLLSTLNIFNVNVHMEFMIGLKFCNWNCQFLGYTKDKIWYINFFNPFLSKFAVEINIIQVFTNWT